MKNELQKAIADYDKAIQLTPTQYVAFHYRGQAKSRLKEYAQAIKDLDTAIQLNGSYVKSLVEEAWILATCPDAQLRDGAKATSLAKKACELSDWKVAAYLETLGMACAEAGDFEEAIKWQQKALEDKEFAKQRGEAGQHLLKLYRDNKPYHVQ